MDCVGRRKARKFNTLQIATKKKKRWKHSAKEYKHSKEHHNLNSNCITPVMLLPLVPAAMSPRGCLPGLCIHYMSAYLLTLLSTRLLFSWTSFHFDRGQCGGCATDPTGCPCTRRARQVIETAEILLSNKPT